MKKLIITFCLSIFLALTCATAFATDNVQAPVIYKPKNLPGPSETQIQDEGNRQVLGEKLLPRIAVFITGLAGALAMLFLIIAGVRYATLYGNDEGVEKAKNQVIYSIVGLLVALFAYILVQIVSNIEYVNQTKPNSPAQTQQK